MENNNLATEILHQLKTTIKMLFTVSLVEFVVILVLVFLMLVPVEEYTTTQTVDDIERSTVTQNVGGDFIEGTTDSNV